MKLRAWMNRKNQKGAAVVEYALLAALIGLAIVVAVTAMSGQIGVVFGRVRTALGG